MFDQNQKRIGFCCKVVGENSDLYNGKTTTHQWLSRQSQDHARQRLWDIMVHNIQSFEELVKYVGTFPHSRRMVRLGSDCLPFYTHAAWRQYWQQSDVQRFLERAFAKVGEAARRFDVRLSFHPGQFVCLASDRPGVVDRSIEEVEYHVAMAQWMGFAQQFQDFKINVHVSGRLGTDGIRAVWPRLSGAAQRTITFENDEFGHGVDQVLEIADLAPIVLDIHHHFVRTGEYIQPKHSQFQQIMQSWRGVRPAIHYSYSRNEHLPQHYNHRGLPSMHWLLENGCKKQKLRAHSDSYPNPDANQWALSFWPHTDIQCEVKLKNQASHQLWNEANAFQA